MSGEVPPCSVCGAPSVRLFKLTGEYLCIVHALEMMDREIWELRYGEDG